MPQITLKSALYRYRRQYSAMFLVLSGILLQCSAGKERSTQHPTLTLSEFYPFGPTILESARPALIASDGRLVYSLAKKNQTNFDSYIKAVRANNCQIGYNSAEFESLKNQIRSRNRSLLKQLQIRLDSIEAKYIQFEAKSANLDQFQRRRSLLETIAEERFEKLGNVWLQTYQSCDIEKSQNTENQTTGLFLAYYTAFYRFLEVLPPTLRSSF
ncbi:MAG: hypothetical protein H3C43_06035 [Leptonema sp. (in: Bacteria)]|nr:hypothetical protein [Leptonema sp. (in: bacteria)]